MWFANWKASIEPDNANPATLEALQARVGAIRAGIEALPWFPQTWPPLDVQITRTWNRSGYDIYALIFQVVDGLYQSANLYVPTDPGPHPAVLLTAGNWFSSGGGSKSTFTAQESQQMCQSLVKKGYVVLSVDILGSLDGFTNAYKFWYSWAAGATSGSLYFLANIRAIDYLCSRPDVDPSRIGVTGSSTGGSTTNMIGAYDTRVRACVPFHMALTGTSFIKWVHSSHIPAGLGEIMRGSDTYRMNAPRRMYVHAENWDSPSIAQAAYALYGAADKQSFFSGSSNHDLAQDKRLLAISVFNDEFGVPAGNEDPVFDPFISNAKVYPEGWPSSGAHSAQHYENQKKLSLNWYLWNHGGEVLPVRAVPTSQAELDTLRSTIQSELETKILRGFPDGTNPLSPSTVATGTEGGRPYTRVTYQPEAGLDLPMKIFREGTGQQPTVIVIHPWGIDPTFENQWSGPRSVSSLMPDCFTGGHIAALLDRGFTVVALEIRCTGDEGQIPGDFWHSPNATFRSAPDHDQAVRFIYAGYPPIRFQIHDIRRCVDYLQTRTDIIDPDKIGLFGYRSMGIEAIWAAMYEPRLAFVAAEDMLARYRIEPFPGYTYHGRYIEHQRLSWSSVPPAILEVADLPVLTALIAPRPVLIVRASYPWTTEGSLDQSETVWTALTQSKALAVYDFAVQTYANLGVTDRLSINELTAEQQVVDWMWAAANGTLGMLVIDTTSLPSGTRNVDYNQSLQASGGVQPYHWSIINGALPDGLDLSSGGIISGKPTVVGTADFTVEVSDSGVPVQTASASLSITIDAVPPLVITSSQLPGGAVGLPYNFALSASGGVQPYMWSVIQGALPDGLTLSLDGLISGLPTRDGEFAFTVRVTDSDTPMAQASKPLSLSIGLPPAPPGSVVATAVAFNRVRLSWQDNSNNEASFELQRRIGGGSYSGLDSVPADTTTFWDQSVAASTSYQYRVRAVNDAGASAWVESNLVTTPESPDPSIVDPLLVLSVAENPSEKDNLVDGDDVTYWKMTSDAAAWVVFDLQIPYVPTRFEHNNDPANPRSCTPDHSYYNGILMGAASSSSSWDGTHVTVLGADDPGGPWTVLASDQEFAYAGGWQGFDLNASQAYRYIKLQTAGPPPAGAGKYGAREFRIFGIPSAVSGDVDGDGDVDVFDVIAVISAFGSQPGGPNWDSRCDFDGNGVVDVFDVVTAVNNFGA